MSYLPHTTVLIVYDRQVPLIRRVCEIHMLRYYFERHDDTFIFLHIVLEPGVSQSILLIGMALGRAGLD